MILPLFPLLCVLVSSYICFYDQLRWHLHKAGLFSSSPTMCGVKCFQISLCVLDLWNLPLQITWLLSFFGSCFSYVSLVFHLSLSLSLSLSLPVQTLWDIHPSPSMIDDIFLIIVTCRPFLHFHSDCFL